MIRSLEPLDIFGCIYPRPRKQWDLIGGLGVHQLGPNRRRSPINPELPIVLPGDGLVTLMQIDAPTYSRIWHNSSPSCSYNYTDAAPTLVCAERVTQ